jgi:hypothetical protein
VVRLWQMLRTVLVLLCLAGYTVPLAAAVEVTIDRNPVQVNESFQLVFALDHSPSKDPDFSVLQQHFLVLGNNRSSSISIINGKYQRSVKWTLQLIAKQIGEYKIPSIRFDDERSEPFTVTVQPSTLASVPHDRQVLELTVDKSEVYVQSQVILTMRLLSATDISAYQFGDIDLQDQDLVIEPLGDVRQYQTRIADRSYLVLEKQFALFPQRSGQLDIPPVLAEVRLRSSSSFDPFNNGGKIRRFRSQPVVIDVAPIPAGFNGGYWLPADRVELREQWPADLEGLVAGEPITRSLVLIADGLTAAQLPEIEFQAITGIKQYPDQPVLKNSRSSTGISSQRLQKVALIPSAAGIYRVPEISVNWWNRATGKMETARLPARKLVVAPGAGTGVTQALPDESQLVPAGVAQASLATPANSHFWPWLSLVLACGWALTMAWWWRTRSRPTNTIEASSTVHLSRARRELKQACGGDDAAAARRALLDWGSALLAPQRIANLRELCDRLGEDLRREVDALNQSLYAGDEHAWQGGSLWALCQQLDKINRSDKRETASELQPLNP